MSEWQETALVDISTIQTGPFGSLLHERDYVKEGTPIITVEHLVDNKISKITDIPKVTDFDKERLNKFVLKVGDIVLSRVGSVDRCGYVSDNENGWLFSGRLLRIRIEDKNVYPKFVYYYISQNIIKEFIKRIAVGSTMPSLNTELISKVPVLLPDLTTQRIIANILTTFDDKIDLLRRQNETLEKIAQAIFKRWFVDFEFPDEAGNPYKSSGGKMVPSELGEIPQGWRVGKLGEVADISIGRTPPRKEKEWFSKDANDKKWISIKDLGLSGVYIDNTSEYLTTEAINRFNIPIIPKNTVVLSFKLTIGRVAITAEEMLSNEAIAHIKLLKNIPISTELMYLFLKNFNYSNLGSTSSIATAINSKIIKQIGLIIPDENSHKAFCLFIKSIFEKIMINIKQINTLTKLRDGLLPKLMSGKIRVKE